MAAAPFYKPNTQDTNSGWGPGYDWSGDCSSYAALAWHDGADVNIYFGNAAQMYQHYRGMPGFHTGGVPPRGALVFWQFSTLGHVMVSLGDGEVAGTQGTDGQHLLTFAVPMSYENGRLGAALGWIQPG